MTTLEIVKNYIEEVIEGNSNNLESYVNMLFKDNTKEELKRYCKENTIYISYRDDKKEDILNRIYGSCKSQLDYRMLSMSKRNDESIIDFYKRIYEKHFQNVDFTNSDNKIVDDLPKEYSMYLMNSNNRYPESIIKILREDEGLNQYDFSKDEELNKLTPNEVFEKVMIWNGLYEEMYVIKEWVEGTYGLKLDDK